MPLELGIFLGAKRYGGDGSGCRAIMDEAGVGPGAAAFRKADEGRMHRGHALWLATLKWVSEGG
jgi:hypothetical protein